MYRLRADVEDKLNRLPLRYVDSQPRGDLLSRVTNDIDNIAQSLQQTLSQMLTSSLTLVGVRRHDADHLAAAGPGRPGHHPALAAHRSGSSPSGRRSRFVAQWAHTGTPQRPGRGGLHRPLAGQGVRPPARRRGAVQRQERGAVRGQLRRPVHLRHHPAGDDVPRQPQLRGHRRDRRAAGGVGADDPRRHPGVHPVLPPVHPAAHPAGVDGQRPAVGRSPRPSGCSSCSTSRGERRPRLRPAHRRPAPRPGRVRPRVVLLRPGEPADRRPVPGGRAGPDGGHRRARPAPARPRWST